MRSIEKFNPDDPDHVGFIYDLGIACKPEWVDDYCDDILIFIANTLQAIRVNSTIMILCLEEEERIGAAWVEIDNRGIGYIHFCLKPEARKGFAALHFIRVFINICFYDLKLRKLEAYFPSFNRVAEKLIRRVGFRKEGFRNGATLINGNPVNQVILGLTKEKYEGLNNGTLTSKAAKHKYPVSAHPTK